MVDFAEPGALGTFTDEATVREARAQDGQARLPRGRRDGRHVRHAAGQRPDLQLRRLQLADGQAAAGVRHPGLERRLHPDAGRDALVLPAHLLRAEQVRQGRAGAGRAAARSRATSTRTCTSSPPSTTTSCRGSPSYATVEHVRRPGPVRPVQRRPHRRHRQPARAQGLVPVRRRVPGDRRAAGGRRPPACRARGGRTGPSGGHERAGDLVDSAAIGQRQPARCSATAPATTSAPEKERRP